MIAYTTPRGTTRREFSLDIAYNPSRWLELPPRWEAEGWQDIDVWARECAGLFWRAYGQDPGESGIALLAGTLRRFAEAFAPDAFDMRVLLRVWEPTSMPLQVFTHGHACARGPRGDTPLLVGADDPDAVEPPVVESFRTELLGERLRAFRYLRQDINAQVSAVHATSHVLWLLPGAPLRALPREGFFVSGAELELL